MYINKIMHKHQHDSPIACMKIGQVYITKKGIKRIRKATKMHRGYK
jgi:hypothetical protein